MYVLFKFTVLYSILLTILLVFVHSFETKPHLQIKVATLKFFPVLIFYKEHWAQHIIILIIYIIFYTLI